MQNEQELDKVLKQAFSGPDAEHLKEIRATMQMECSTYEKLLNVAANLFWDLSQSDAGLEYLANEAQGYTKAEKLLADSSLDAHQRMTQLEAISNKAARIAQAAIALRKSSIAQRGGVAKANLSAAQDQTIIAAYDEHAELHGLSGDAAATSLIDKHPEITTDIGISYRRIANLIRAQRK